jgi:hypothetical protein
MTSDSGLLELGRERAMELLYGYGNKTCPDCGHSNWAHGVEGCGFGYFGANPCRCKTGKTNEEIIFGTDSESPS